MSGQRDVLPAMKEFTSGGRTEWLITTSRVVLAAFSLLAERLGAHVPATHARIAVELLSVYLVYSLVLFFLLWFLRKLPTWWKIATQILDLAAFLVFMYLTQGTGSPYFVYFTFSLASSTLRWHRRGALWMAAAAIPAFAAMGLYSGFVEDPSFDLNGFIVRTGYLIVVAALLFYLGTSQERVHDARSRLAAWPRSDAGEAFSSVRELLEHAAEILQAPRMLVVWEESEESEGSPIKVAIRSNGAFELREEPAGVFGTLVAEPLAGKSFLCSNAASDAARVFLSSPPRRTEWTGTPLDPRLAARFGIGPVLSWSLRGQAIEGRLFALDKPAMTWDDLVLGQIVASLAAARMDHIALRERLREAAAAEERVRLSRDLHDGLLQSLTGVALQLQVSRRLIERDPQEARARLAEVQSSIAVEQRELRAFVNRLKPETTGQPAPDRKLLPRLEEACDRIERQWGLHVKLTSQGLTDELPSPVAEDVFRIVHEAVINAARHAKATSLSVDVLGSAGSVFITVADDGHGFSFHGTYDLATLQQIKAGPITLKERIAALGGDLVISSSESGSRLAISLPVGQTVV